MSSAAKMQNLDEKIMIIATVAVLGWAWVPWGVSDRVTLTGVS